MSRSESEQARERVSDVARTQDTREVVERQQEVGRREQDEQRDR